MNAPRRQTRLSRAAGFWIGRFRAMACPCELLTDAGSATDAKRLLKLVSAEAWRIEDKFSRYLDGNIIHRINVSDGAPVEVDDETARLIDFSESLHRLSEGRFDITSGALREAWSFDGSDNVPCQSRIDAILPRIGWDKVCWENRTLTLRHGMQIDLGGVGKEYAVDRCAGLCRERTQAGCLVNFGGDIAVSRSRETQPWRVGIEAAAGKAHQPTIALTNGGVATSGDSRRFLLKDGVRYSHILDPLTGWPVAQAPRAVTVVAQSCTQAGMMATLASLQGAEAEAFLDAQGLRYWIQR